MKTLFRVTGINFRVAKDVFLLLSKSQRLSVSATLIARLGLVILDLLGIVLIGAVVSLLSGTTISRSSTFGSLLSWLEFNGIKNGYAVILTTAVSFFILKGIASVFLSLVTARFISKIEVQLAERVFSNLMETTLEVHEKTTDQMAIYSSTQSVTAATTKAIMVGTSICAEVALLIAISFYLATVDFFLFLAVALFFGFVGWILNRFVTRAAGTKAAQMHVTDLESQGIVLDVLSGMRQISNSPNRHTIKNRFSETRKTFASLSADYQVIATLPRYITEIAVMLGVGILVLQRSLDSSNSTSAAVIAVFLAGIFRIVSSMIPLQTALTNWKSVEFEAAPALSSLNESNTSRKEKVSYSKSPKFKSGIYVDRLTYLFPKTKKPIIEDASVLLEIGTFIAIVGKSGSGKSTFVDLLMGLRRPTSGFIYVNGVESNRFRSSNPGFFGYVPQKTTILRGSIRENVSLNFLNSNSKEVKKVQEVLSQVGMSDLADRFTDGLETRLGSGNMMLSGGEIQRLGLARALYGNPKVLVLDEATSALDSGSQEAILSLLESLRGKITIIVIAHRLETIRNADILYRISKGKFTKISRDEFF